ncbi:hypothetical protein D0Z07_4866 [Hyphodiscus hymeniophilus]|uniref:Alb1-domain-containing protein n=1 Tax=Hyphodiscus hymeniophilus TaxID=353542 RepID=A0A9P7AWQ2_9HELO|nr:hypothetical protein D0Z07_4866 [Hyphodiscus hymeniophilus]
MAKTAPLKRKGVTSVHSRAAKRASSPSIDTDKSLKNVKPPTTPGRERPSVLAVHQGSGVSKKSKNGRRSVLSARAKRRQEKGMDMAEAIMDKKEKKIEKSKGRARTVQERAKAWEDLNKKILAKKAAQEALEKENLAHEDDEEEMEVEEEDATNVAPAAESSTTIAMATDPEPQSIPLPEPASEEEEEL